ncbi:MAG: hypothetical protein EOP12_02645 [Pseudomonas sp.]|nr:MAG: hypothetical protein EOP12_02645 [Pseudomonas sp.]
MKKHPSRPGLIERALIEKEWHQTVVDAQIHALYGDNPQGLVDAAGRVLFVVLEGAHIDGHDFDHDELQSVHEAIISMYDQVDEAVVCPSRRARIIGGLEAAELLFAVIQRSSLIQAACRLKEKLREKHIHLDDFEALIGHGTTQTLLHDSWASLPLSRCSGHLQ